MLARIGPFGASLAIHGIAGVALVVLASRPARTETVVQFEVFKPKPKPKPEPPPKEEPKAEEPKPEPKPPPKPKLTTRVKKVEKPRPFDPETKPPPKDEPPPPKDVPPPPPPMGFALDLEATVGMGAGISVRAAEGGGNAYADPDRKDLEPGKGTEAPPPPAPPPPRPTNVLEVTELPRCPQPTVEYPPEARRLGIEGRVQLRLMIGNDGRVTQAKVLKGVGSGLDEAALAAVKKMRCQPGRAGKRAVAVPITYKVTFVLEDW